MTFRPFLTSPEGVGRRLSRRQRKRHLKRSGTHGWSAGSEGLAPIRKAGGERSRWPGERRRWVSGSWWGSWHRLQRGRNGWPASSPSRTGSSPSRLARPGTTRTRGAGAGRHAAADHADRGRRDWIPTDLGVPARRTLGVRQERTQVPPWSSARELLVPKEPEACATCAFGKARSSEGNRRTMQ